MNSHYLGWSCYLNQDTCYLAVLTLLAAKGALPEECKHSLGLKHKTKQRTKHKVFKQNRQVTVLHALQSSWQQLHPLHVSSPSKLKVKPWYRVSNQSHLPWQLPSWAALLDMFFEPRHSFAGEVLSRSKSKVGLSAPDTHCQLVSLGVLVREGPTGGDSTLGLSGSKGGDLGHGTGTSAAIWCTGNASSASVGTGKSGSGFVGTGISGSSVSGLEAGASAELAGGKGGVSCHAFFIELVSSSPKLGGWAACFGLAPDARRRWPVGVASAIGDGFLVLVSLLPLVPGLLVLVSLLPLVPGLLVSVSLLPLGGLLVLVLFLPVLVVCAQLSVTLSHQKLQGATGLVPGLSLPGWGKQQSSAVWLHKHVYSSSPHQLAAAHMQPIGAPPMLSPTMAGHLPKPLPLVVCVLSGLCLQTQLWLLEHW